MSLGDDGIAMEVSPAERRWMDSAQRELIKLIRKLRWIGMEQETEVVARALVGRPLVDIPVAGLADTD
jgi:uncharacterized protein YbcI